MTAPNLCERCGGPLPQSGRLGGKCPRCLLELGLESAGGISESSFDLSAISRSVPKDTQSAGHPVAIARYRILRLIGEGAMGSVYEAEQDLPRRVVALKIMKPGVATPELLRRFELESQALGRLQHPGIAQIYEAGTADTGLGPQPYFAMEFIRGKKLTHYAEDHHLNARQRMEMMAKIAEAVHHAHQRGLIHRDLKPANILVDENGQPKIVDFGVARTTDSDMHATSQTDLGQLVGTVAYMSPEQVLADPLELDTRSDVYALGVILYELLAGRLPYTIGRKLHENIQTIRENDPVKLSAVNRAYRGDIETIVGKALEKDKTMRYASAAGMAADIQRYLNDEPIAARPPSSSYQLRKFAHRNKALVIGVAAVFVALVGGVVAGHWATTKANTEKETAEAVLNSTVRCFFGMANPSTQVDSGQRYGTSNPNLPVKDALDLCMKEVPFQLAGQPLLEAAVRELAADAYTGIGRYSEAKDQLVLALALLRREEGNTEPATLQVAGKLADAYANLKMHSMAEEIAKRVVIDARSSTGDVDPYVRRAVSTLVFIYGTSLANADQARGFSQIEGFLKDEVIDYQRWKSGEADSTVQFVIEKLLFLYTEAKPTPKYSDAVDYMEWVVSNWRRALGEGHPATIWAEKQLIGLYLIPQPQSRYAHAEAFLEPLLDAQRRTLGDENSATQNTLNYLLSVYLDRPQPRYAKAEPLLKKVIEDARRQLGDESRAVRNASIGLANLYFKQTHYADSAAFLIPLVSNAAVAEALANSATLETEPSILHSLDSSQVYGGRINFALADSLNRLSMRENPTILDALDLLAQTHIKQGDTTRANAVTIKLRTILESTLKSEPMSGPAGKNSRTALKSMGAFAIRYIDQERYPDAEYLLNASLDGYRELVESHRRDADAEYLLKNRVDGDRKFAENVVNVRDSTPAFISELRANYQPGNDSQVSTYQQLAGSSTDAQDLATFLTSAAITYSSKGMDLQAERVLKVIRDTDQSVRGDCSWDTQRGFWRLASWYMERAKYAEAHDTYDSLSEIHGRCYGPGHTITRTTMVDIVGVYWDRFRTESSEGRKQHQRHLLQANLDIRSKLLLLYRTEPDGETSGNSRLMISGIGIALAMLERYEPAAERFNQLIAIHEVAEGVALESVPAAIANLGWTQFYQQKLPQAEESLRSALGLYDKIKSRSWERHNTESMLGATLVAARKYDEAEPHLLNSYKELLLLSPAPGPVAGFTAEKARGERILTLYTAWGKIGEAAKWRQTIDADRLAVSR